ncbi:MAG: hypothetical protein WBL23_02380 [Salinisphaera sp.]|uniref:hypothetical protein n=1 Tax=Salinisphaera sp. TaxID=1914330 RepID=UPI003C7B9D28
MTTATVALVAHTALDVEAARRLADYGELDDAGVARALEQVHMQRWGRADLPGHLRRIESLAAVVDDGHTLFLVGAQSADGEAVRLRELFAAWPEGPVELVDWSGAGQALLSARALAHDLALPADFLATRSRALGERIAPAPLDHPVPAAQLELECLRLMAGLDASNDAPAPVMRAAARYRLWLRWQYVTGVLDAEARAVREARLSRIANEDGA